MGVGKSTFLKLLKQKLPHIDILFEPVEKWTSDAFGKSLLGQFFENPNRWEYTIETFGRDVAAVVEKLELEKVILIGHSMGGAVIIEATRQMPGRVIGCVGADTFHNI